MSYALLLELLKDRLISRDAFIQHYFMINSIRLSYVKETSINALMVILFLILGFGSNVPQHKDFFFFPILIYGMIGMNKWNRVGME